MTSGFSQPASHPEWQGRPFYGYDSPAVGIDIESSMVEHAITPFMTKQLDIYAESKARDWDGGSRETAMDNEGIALAVMFPSCGLFSLGRTILT
jgi:hypothetical protein